MLIKDRIYISTKELGYHISGLCEMFTHKNPTIFHKKRLKLSIKNVPPYLYHYKLANDTLEIPTGGLSRVIAFYEEHSIPCRIADARVYFSPLDINLQNTTIEAHQEKIADILIANGGGCIKSEVGSGKTISAISIIARLKQPTLILLAEHRLREQWEKELTFRLIGNFKFGRFDGDKIEDGDICTGLVQTVHKLVDEDPNFLNKFGLLIIDECHHIPAATFLKIVNNSPAKVKIGVSGTLTRKDGMHLLLQDSLGEPLKSINISEVKHRVTNFSFEMVPTNVSIELPSITRWTGSRREATLNITEATTLLCQNEERNKLIISKVVDSLKKGHTALILSDRVNHVKYLFTKLTDLGYKGALIIGETRKQTNWSEIRMDASINFICATSSIASEGLDMPRLSCLHLTVFTSNMPKLEQKLGRIRRKVEGKLLPIVYDYVDNAAYYPTEKGESYIFKYVSNKRIALYKKLQKEYNYET